MYEYGSTQLVAAATSGGTLGSSGAKGDVIETLVIVPETTAPGAVSIKDGGSGSTITLFTGSATYEASLRPVCLRLDAAASTSGGWKITTGSNVHVFAVGNFT